MNKKVYARLIETTNGNQFKDAVIATLDSADDKVLRFLDIVFGCEIKVDELPVQKLDYNNDIDTLTSIDYLNDRVNYIYDDEDKKYFENEELAKNMLKQVNMIILGIGIKLRILHMKEYINIRVLVFVLLVIGLKETIQL